MEPIKIDLKAERDVKKASGTASEIASKLGFDKIESAQITLAVSEIAGNAVKFAGKGTVLLRFSRNKKVLEIIVEDKGPGIKNLKKVLYEGLSTAGIEGIKGLGLGLAAAKRAVDEFFITSKPGKGTKVIMKRHLPIPEEELEFGVVSLPDERYAVNGDAYVVREYDGDKVLLAVIDGTGQGPKANKGANFVKDYIEEMYKSDLKKIITVCDQRLRKKTAHNNHTMSATVSLLALKPRSLEFLGVGDDSIHIISEKKIHLESRLGIIGDLRLPTLRTQKTACPRKIIIIMCSDSITPHFTREELPLDESAQTIADYIMNNYRRQYGDATVLVAKRKK